MPSPYGRAVAAAIFVFVLTFSPYARAETGTLPIGNPEADTLQLWSSIVSSIELIAQDTLFAAGQLTSAMQQLASTVTAPHSTPTSNGPPAPTQVPSAAAQSASLATAVASFESTSGTPATSTESEQATSSETAPDATSYGTTNSQNVKSAVSIKSADFVSADANTGALIAPNNSNFVTQNQFNTAISALGASVQQLLAKSNTNPLPEYVAADGNNADPYAAASAIDNLSNVTITNSNLTASEIPALNYFPSASTISIAYGGTGISSAPSYGQILLGNSSGGYSLVATSSLGIVGGGGSSASSTLLSDNNTFFGNNTFSSLLKMTNGLLATASSTIGNGTQGGGLTISGGATTTGNAYFAGNVGIGTANPGKALEIVTSADHIRASGQNGRIQRPNT